MPHLVSSYCPGSTHAVLLLGPLAPPLRKALFESGLQLLLTAQGRVGAVLLCPVPGQNPSSLFTSARKALARRGRVFVLACASQCPSLLLGLSRSGLEPKRMLVLYSSSQTPAGAVVIIACPAKPGGLEIERLVLDAPSSCSAHSCPLSPGEPDTLC